MGCVAGATGAFGAATAAALFGAATAAALSASLADAGSLCVGLFRFKPEAVSRGYFSRRTRRGVSEPTVIIMPHTPRKTGTARTTTANH